MKFFQRINQMMLLLMITSIGFTSNSTKAMQMIQQASNPHVAQLQAIQLQQDIGQKISLLQTFMQRNLNFPANPEVQRLFSTILVEIYNDGRTALDFMRQTLQAAPQTDLLNATTRENLSTMLQTLNGQVNQAPLPPQVSDVSTSNTNTAQVAPTTDVSNSASPVKRAKNKKRKNKKHKNSGTAIAQEPQAQEQTATGSILPKKRTHRKNKHKQQNTRDINQSTEQPATPIVPQPIATQQTATEIQAPVAKKNKRKKNKKKRNKNRKRKGKKNLNSRAKNNVQSQHRSQNDQIKKQKNNFLSNSTVSIDIPKQTAAAQVIAQQNSVSKDEE